MPYAQSNGARIYYRVVEQRGNATPAAEPLVLLHGYTASSTSNWVFPGFVSALAPTNRIVLLDFRGHGKSEKFIRSEHYSRELLASDAIAVMDTLGIPRARLFGYSMGAMIASDLLINHPDRFSGAILGGMGVEWPRRGSKDARDEEPPGFQPEPVRRRDLHRVFEYLRETNPLALRAVYQGVFKGQQPMDVQRLPEIRVPVLAIVGTRDRLAPGTRPLPNLISDCERTVLYGRGHVSALADPAFKTAAIEFLASLNEPATVAV